MCERQLQLILFTDNMLPYSTTVKHPFWAHGNFVENVIENFKSFFKNNFMHIWIKQLAIGPSCCEISDPQLSYLEIWVDHVIHQ